jgi:hypothetical protein
VIIWKRIPATRRSVAEEVVESKFQEERKGLGMKKKIWVENGRDQECIKMGWIEAVS